MARDDVRVSLGDVSLACAWALVEELVRGGVRHACVSPGSRSTPITLALARHPAVSVHVHLDERSSGFFGLGLAKATGEPVVVACTSGTAAAELLPAAIEASRSRASLLLLTADRPPRLRGTGANQTIDQVELYGGVSRAYLEPPVPALDRDVRGAWAAAGRDAIAAAGGLVPGPVHVNCCVDEPLAPTSTGAPPAAADGTASAEADGTASAVPPEPPVDGRALLDALGDRGRGVVVVGGLRVGGSAVRKLASRLGWPLLAEPVSNLRRPGAVEAGQALAGSSSWREAMPPEVVLQVGATPTTRATQALVATAPMLIVLDDGAPDPDPDHRAAAAHRGRADRAAEAILAHLAPEGPPTPWLTAWHEAGAAARAAIDRVLDATDEPCGPRVARDLAAWVPAGGSLFVGNSMPVRDLDETMAPREGLRVLANRGASGIDGLLSTALGVAASGPGPTAALLGDLSFLYDVGPLLWRRGEGPGAVVVVNDNGGGQIFASLGQRSLPDDELRDLFVTPPSADIAAICAAAGVGHARVERSGDLVPTVEAAQAAGGVHVVQVMIDAGADRRHRARARDAAEAAIALALTSRTPGPSAP